MSRAAVRERQQGTALPVDWSEVTAGLDAKGFAVMPKLLSPEACAAVAAMYPEDDRFRSRIVMERHGSVRANTNISLIPCRTPSANFARRFIRILPVSRTAGTWRWASTSNIQRRTLRFSTAVMRQAKRAPHLFFFSMSQETTIACTRTSTGSMFSRCRWRSCSRSLVAILRVANSF